MSQLISSKSRNDWENIQQPNSRVNWFILKKWHSNRKIWKS